MRVTSALGIRITGQNKDWLNASCPFAPWFHKNGTDNSASFGVKINEGGKSAFVCKACKKHGTIRYMVRQLAQLRGMDYSDVLQGVTELERGGVAALAMKPFDRPYAEEVDPRPQPLKEALYDGLWPRAWDVPEARVYLQSRGISEETAGVLGLMFRKSYPSPKDPNRQWVRDDIVFPVRDRDGHLMGFSGRTIHPSDRVKPKVYDPDLPKRWLILGEHRWREGYPKLLIEGLFGYAHLIEIGCEDFCDVGAILGSAMTPEKVELLKAWGDTVVLGMDNDEAGDTCLFGPIKEYDERTGEPIRDEENAAVSMLLPYLVTIVPAWPVWQDGDKAGLPKDDPDQLTKAEVKTMVLETLPLQPPRPKKNTSFRLTNKR